MLANPQQPLVIAKDGVVRFKQNKIVEYLLENGGIDMNHLALKNFSQEDREQFAQLIGCSVGDFGSLSYASDEVYTSACEQSRKLLSKEEEV